MIHVCYGLYDGDGKYSKWTGTSILSMFENTSAPPNSITVHILHDLTLTQSNLEKFLEVAELYRQNIEFHNIEMLYPEKFKFLRDNLGKVFQSRFSVGTFYRLMIEKQMFQPANVSKIIYLDSDTIVNLDIAELWNYPMGNYPIAAVPEIQATGTYIIKDKHLLKTGKVKAENYLCAGVLMINFDKLDKKFFYDGVKWLAKNPDCECFDQDILNNFFSKNYLKLPEKFNAFVDIARRFDNNIVFKKIYHYAGQDALGFDMQNSYDKLFFSYFTKSPWFNENVLANMFETAKKQYAQAKDLATIYTAISAGKKRVFFTSAELVAAIKQIFDVTDKDKILLEDAPNSVAELMECVKISHDENIFLIMSDNFFAIRDKLNAAGFPEGQNFLDATLFLSEVPGVPLNSWFFLKAM